MDKKHWENKNDSEEVFSICDEDIRHRLKEYFNINDKNIIDYLYNIFKETVYNVELLKQFTKSKPLTQYFLYYNDAKYVTIKTLVEKYDFKLFEIKYLIDNEYILYNDGNDSIELTVKSYNELGATKKE